MGRFHILLLTPSLWPLHRDSRGRAVADLADALHAAGARVSIMTTAEGCVDTLPLARRLEGLPLATPAQTRHVAWFQGRSPSGCADVWAAATSDWVRLGPEALRLSGGRRSVDIIHAVDDAAAALVAIRTVPSIATLTELPRLASEAWSAGVENARAVVVPSQTFARHPSPAWRPALAGARQVVGILHGSRTPSAVRDAESVRSVLGLSRHLPLATTHGPVDVRRTGDLHQLPSLPLCVVAATGAQTPAGCQLAPLAERHPRRIVLLERNDPRLAAVRACADLHIFGAAYYPNPEDPLGSAPTLAVAHSSGSFADSIVPWDQGSESGNGFRFADGELLTALAQATKALSASAQPLLRRARRLQPSWQRAGQQYRLLYQRLAALTAD